MAYILFIKCLSDAARKKSKKNNNSNNHNNLTNNNSSNGIHGNGHSDVRVSNDNHHLQMQQQQQQHRQLMAGTQSLFDAGSGFWSCAVCKYIFPSELALVSHIQQMRSDGKHHVLFAMPDTHHLNQLANHAATSSMDILKKNMI